jgi:hypothetical protein
MSTIDARRGGEEAQAISMDAAKMLPRGFWRRSSNERSWWLHSYIPVTICEEPDAEGKLRYAVYVGECATIPAVTMAMLSEAQKWAQDYYLEQLFRRGKPKP